MASSLNSFEYFLRFVIFYLQLSLLCESRSLNWVVESIKPRQPVLFGLQKQDALKSDTFG